MGGKRVRVDSKFQTKKRSKKQDVIKDGINELPDEILVDILSFLSLKEAARTSVVSSRWRDLWKQSPTLTFDADRALLVKIEQYKQRSTYAREREEYMRNIDNLLARERGKYIKWDNLCAKERGKYIKWVNRIIGSYKPDRLKEFTVFFDLDKLFSNSITRWVEFALGRHVEKLVLDFSPKLEHSNSSTHYAFPEKFLAPTSIDFKSLRELCFRFVNVTGEAIEFFLRNCPLLEKVAVEDTKWISHLQVCGPSLALKHLEMGVCYYLNSVRISAPNLTSLKVHKVDYLFLDNVPKLVEMSANCLYRHDCVSNLLEALSWRIYQLEILTLQFDDTTEVIVLSSFPQLPKLNKLVIRYWWSKDDTSLMPLTFLIRAAPNLQEFVLELVWDDEPVRLLLLCKNAEKMAQSLLHQHLKVFKLCGYYGRSSDVELVEYIVHNCVVLEKITIDPNKIIFKSSQPSRKELDKVQIARDHAKTQLQARVPQHVELVIL